MWLDIILQSQETGLGQFMQCIRGRLVALVHFLLELLVPPIKPARVEAISLVLVAPATLPCIGSRFRAARNPRSFALFQLCSFLLSLACQKTITH